MNRCVSYRSGVTAWRVLPRGWVWLGTAKMSQSDLYGVPWDPKDKLSISWCLKRSETILACSVASWCRYIFGGRRAGAAQKSAMCSNTASKYASGSASFMATTTVLRKAVEMGNCHKGLDEVHVSSGKSKVLTSYVEIDAGIMRCLQHHAVHLAGQL